MNGLHLGAAQRFTNDRGMSLEAAAPPQRDPQRIVRGAPAYRRLSLALLIAGFATFSLLYTTQPLLPLFAAQYRIGAAQASFAVSFATGAMALAFIPASILSDRIGRRPMMVASLFASAALTIVSALLPGWGVLLAMRALTGVALAGVPAIAMAYVAEECDTASIAPAMGLYIAGSAIGGMAGRLGVTALSELFGWRTALGTLGVLALAGAAVFAAAAPRSRAFSPRRHDLSSLLAAAGRLARDQAMPWLFLEGLLLMGAFVTVYNYVGFRLLAPPYRLTQTEVGLIFLMYILGSISSAYVGGLAGRIGSRKVFWPTIAVLIAGVALTAPRPLILIVAGVGVITAAFFGAHSTASGWVSRRAGRDKALASSIYLLFYYGGSSILGSIGGLAWTRGAWNGVALYACGLAALALLIALRLTAVKPLPEPAKAGAERVSKSG